MNECKGKRFLSHRQGLQNNTICKWILFQHFIKTCLHRSLLRRRCCGHNRLLPDQAHREHPISRQTAWPE